MIQGVGLILLNPTGHILVIKELVTKSSIKKEAGMFSIPLETMKRGETEDEALMRLVIEEVGSNVCLTDVAKFGSFPIADTIIYPYIASCEHSIDEFQPLDTDIEIVGWAEPQQLLTMHVRREVPPILNAYILLQSKRSFSG